MPEAETNLIRGTRKSSRGVDSGKGHSVAAPFETSPRTS